MSRAVVLLHRIAHALHGWGVPVLPLVVALVNRLVFGCWIGPGARLGARVSLGYGGLGVVVHGRAVVGDDVRVGPGVVIGGRSKEWGVPVIGDRCVISTGAKVLGKVTLGDEVVVGANAVVIADVDARCVVAGVPARVVRREIEIGKYHDGVEAA